MTSPRNISRARKSTDLRGWRQSNERAKNQFEDQRMAFLRENKLLKQQMQKMQCDRCRREERGRGTDQGGIEEKHARFKLQQFELAKSKFVSQHNQQIEHYKQKIVQFEARIKDLQEHNQQLLYERESYLGFEQDKPYLEAKILEKEQQCRILMKKICELQHTYAQATKKTPKKHFSLQTEALFQPAHRTYSQPAPQINFSPAIDMLREALIRQIWAIFIRSYSQSDSNQSSLNIFSIHLENFDTARIFPYIKTYKELLRICGVEASPEKISQKNLSSWALRSIANVKAERKRNSHIKSSKMTYLYRLLTIVYRLAYPQEGQKQEPDLDVGIILHNSIILGISDVITQ